MKNYYLPKNYPDTEKGARLYLEDIKTNGSKEKFEQEKRAITLINNYYANSGTKPILDALENERGLIHESKIFREFIKALWADAFNVSSRLSEQLEKTRKIVEKDTGNPYEIKYYIPENYPSSEAGIEKQE